MHITTARARAAAWIALPIAVVASGSIIATASYAAFSATTDNDGNTWTSGKVALTDDDQGKALFDVDGLLPGQSGENCLTVTANTSDGAAVKLYTSATSDPNNLGDHINVKVERGTLATENDCSSFTSSDTDFTGTLSALAAATSFGGGVGAWTPDAGEQSTVYRIHYEMPADTDNSAQDATASTTFVWEAQQR